MNRLLKNIIFTFGILFIAVLVCFILRLIDNKESNGAYFSMVFVLAVLLIARVTDGYAYGVLASCFGVLAVNYLFTYPYYAFNFSLPGYPVAIICMFAVSILTGTLTQQVKKQEEAKRIADK